MEVRCGGRGGRMRRRSLAPAACGLLISASYLAAILIASDQDSPLVIEPRSSVDYARSRKNAEAGLPKINVNTNLVLVPVTVFDLRDRVVLGLLREHFKLYDNDVEQSITHFAQEDA